MAAAAAVGVGARPLAGLNVETALNVGRLRDQLLRHGGRYFSHQVNHIHNYTDFEIEGR